MALFSPFEERTVAILNNNMRCERNLQYAARIESYFRLNGWSVRPVFGRSTGTSLPARGGASASATTGTRA